MTDIRTKEFWLWAGMRAARTFLTVFAAMFISFNQLSDFPYLQGLSAAALAGLLSLLTSLVGLPELDGKSEPKWLAVLMRTLKTLVQTLLALIPTNAIYLEQINWLEVLQVSMTAAVGSLLYGLVSILPEETGRGSLPQEAKA